MNANTLKIQTLQGSKAEKFAREALDNVHALYHTETVYRSETGDYTITFVIQLPEDTDAVETGGSKET